MILRVAYRSSCDYEFAHHSVIAAAAGLTEAEVKALVGAGEFDWPGADLALISLVDELLDSWSVSDETWGLLCDYDPKDLVELVTLVGFYAMTAMLNKALLIQLENGLEPLPHSTA